jgi:acetyl-CoA carboxylase carboxyl transferase subunit alpha
VISPEGCAAILFRDASRAAEAATALKLTAPELKELGVIDQIIPEAAGGAHRKPGALMEALRAAVKTHLDQLSKLSTDELLENRYRKFRSLGAWRDQEVEKVSRRRRKTQNV